MAQSKTIAIIYENVSHELQNPEDKTILEVALDSGLDVPYSCQGGVCSTCVARIEQGEASMKNNEILTDREISEGLVLCCQAVPSTDYIRVNFDDSF
ncbi:MAG: 2Fe-2S iron-sulfur cluster-binding protein [Flavobacteriaceae bacterium]|nr:2Fe-2S iron-sulfur cluster-binding protein [Flavobacteriaceae bacterium]MCY4268051.1 2Fe-2S iron-sulfur cluster-binding protein [Flavobacteriaceae bacterium]